MITTNYVETDVIYIQ